MCFFLFQIKSYESISSLSSDGLKAGGNSGTTHTLERINVSGGSHIDSEPYYDTVPIEETDDEIEAENENETNCSNILRNATSSLPKLIDRQISVDSGGQVGERVSNYINIDYFLS